jgi:hypothetical protein
MKNQIEYVNKIVNRSNLLFKKFKLSLFFAIEFHLATIPPNKKPQKDYTQNLCEQAYSVFFNITFI